MSKVSRGRAIWWTILSCIPGVFMYLMVKALLVYLDNNNRNKY